MAFFTLPKDPVILDPSGPQFGIVLSDDLTSVEAKPIQDPSCPLSNFYAFILGSEAFTDGCHAWDVHVGNSLCWIVGVTSPSHPAEVPFTINPSSGYFAIQRENDKYLALTSPNTHLNLPSSRPLQVLRVKLRWSNAGNMERQKSMKVTFSDAQRGSHIFTFKHEGHTGAIYPFLCPLGRGSKLRLEPAEVKVEVRETLGFWEKYGPEILLYGSIGFLVMCIIIQAILDKAAKTT